MNNFDLIEYGDEHIRYELDMLMETHQKLKTTRPDQITINILLESRALHFRNLHDFLKHDTHRSWYEQDAVIARDYAPEFSFTSDPLLTKLTDQCDKQISHLTEKRVSDMDQKTGIGSKSWVDMIVGIPKLLVQLKRFIDECPDEKKPKKLEKAINKYCEEYQLSKPPSRSTSYQ